MGFTTRIRITMSLNNGTHQFQIIVESTLPSKVPVVGIKKKECGENKGHTDKKMREKLHRKAFKGKKRKVYLVKTGCIKMQWKKKIFKGTV